MRHRKKQHDGDVAGGGAGQGELRGGTGRGGSWRRRLAADTASTSFYHETTSWTTPSLTSPRDLVTPTSEVTEVTADSLVISDADDAERGDMMMILLPSNDTVMTSADINERGRLIVPRLAYILHDAV